MPVTPGVGVGLLGDRTNGLRSSISSEPGKGVCVHASVSVLMIDIDACAPRSAVSRVRELKTIVVHARQSIEGFRVCVGGDTVQESEHFSLIIIIITGTVCRWTYSSGKRALLTYY